MRGYTVHFGKVTAANYPTPPIDPAEATRWTRCWRKGKQLLVRESGVCVLWERNRGLEGSRECGSRGYFLMNDNILYHT